MNEKCQYYFIEEHVLKSKKLTGDRNPVRPKREKKPRCTHTQSKHKRRTLTADCPCEGDLEKCVIPEVWRPPR